MVKSYFSSNLKSDIPAGLVVFLVALPLCLGIALASGAPLMSGLITGIVGGVVVALLSGSQLAVSGPAAGLTIIVLNGIENLGSYQAFIMAVVVAGVLQLAFGFLRAGIVAYYFPVSVIKGMLAAIGLILILKQIPHFLGVDNDTFGDLEFFQADGLNTFSEIFYALSHVNPGPVIIGVISLAILIIWERKPIKNISWLQPIPGALIVVILGILLNSFFINSVPYLAISQDHLVTIPLSGSFQGLAENLTIPDFTQLSNPQLYVTAITLAIVASLETLLSLEATDKLDPHRRVSPTNRELKAQGVGNIIAGMIGGLPMTAVIVRSSANITSGAQSKMSAFFHGLLLVISVTFFGELLNLIPLASLAAILLVIGYKLTKPSLFKLQYNLGFEQFMPFVITILAILFTDLLIGICIGLVVGFYFILRINYKNPYFYRVIESEDHSRIKIELSEQVTFLNKARVIETLKNLPENATVEISGEKSLYISHDIIEVIDDFQNSAPDKNITLHLTQIPDK